jgi:hypothetical protein
MQRAAEAKCHAQSSLAGAKRAIALEERLAKPDKAVFEAEAPGKSAAKAS